MDQLIINILKLLNRGSKPSLLQSGRQSGLQIDGKYDYDLRY